MKRRHEGFSLVELLIVLAIMAVLASTMLLTLGVGSDKAEATKIVSELQSLRAAAALYAADRAGTVDADVAPTFAQLQPYLQGSAKLTDQETRDRYCLYPTSGDSAAHWYVGRVVTTGSGVSGKLELQAKELDLLGGPKEALPTERYLTTSPVVWLQIR